MIAFNPLFEKSTKEKDEAEFTGKEVGSGMGKLIGGAVSTGTLGAALPGWIAGHHVGKNMGPKKFDVTKKSHRVGGIMSRQVGAESAKSAGKWGAIGAGLGAAAGAAHAASRGDDAAEGAARGAVGGGALGAAGGFTGRSMQRGYRAAKKMGYGGVGKVAGAVTPLTGLFTPKGQKKK